MTEDVKLLLQQEFKKGIYMMPGDPVNPVPEEIGFWRGAEAMLRVLSEQAPQFRIDQFKKWEESAFRDGGLGYREAAIWQHEQDKILVSALILGNRALSEKMLEYGKKAVEYKDVIDRIVAELPKRTWFEIEEIALKALKGKL